MRDVIYLKLKNTGLIIGFIIFFIFLTIFILNAYKSKSLNNSYVSTIIVPHHDLVSKQRQEVFEKIAPKTQNRRIILLAPNHYNSGTANIQTRLQTFTTQYGDIKVDDSLFKLVSSYGAEETNSTFEAEHGIKALLPDIAKYYPNSNILPLVIKQTSSQKELNNLLSALNKNCQDCLMIVSADFSHYQPYLLSKLHDELTIRGLQNLDGELLDSKAELEPMHHVWMAVKWAELHNTKHFELAKHTFSHEVLKDFYAEGTTHIMGWYERGQPAKPDSSASFAIAGSLNFNSGEPKKNQNLPTLFNQLGERVLWGTDLVLGNLKLDIPANKNIIDTLKPLRFTHFYSQNNEIVKNIGANVLNKTDIISGQSQQIKIFSGGASQISVEKIKENQASNIIIYTDWELNNKQQRQELAHKWIDNGADMVIGINEEEISEIELYENRPIAYSLGNFVSLNKPDGYSMVLAGEFTNDEINLLPLLIKNQNGQPILARSVEADQILAKYFVQFKHFETDSKGGLLYSLPK